MDSMMCRKSLTSTSGLCCTEQRKVIYHLLHIIETCLDITLVELGESADKEELDRKSVV